MNSILKSYFGFSQFRLYQKEIIDQVLDGRDCLVVMATGSGKSLCYQVPPLVRGKIALVVSPLLSLMQDQVMSLKQRGIRAEYLGSTQTDKTIHSQAESGSFDVLYMTPEKACSLPERFWANLLNIGVCLLAVDEAHCISEWGHDFRKEYKQLHTLRGVLPGVPFIGLTATATEKVRNDIVRSLKMDEPFIAVGSFDRPNLFYGVKSVSRSMSFVDELVAEISKHNASAGSTIIYCTTIKDTEQISESLRSAGIKTGIYHGQMSGKAREESHRSFIRDELQVMVATIAFGMGIDKPNIRCVIHYGCPKSLESYYQESGRCGRDGLASICWLYYSRADFSKAEFYCGEAQSASQRKAIMESFMAAEKYCVLPTCRRNFLLQYFGEESSTDCGNCDNCTGSKQERDLSRESFLLLSCVHSCGSYWGLNMPIDVLRGSRARKILDNNFDKLPSHGLGKDYSPTWWKALGGLLLVYGYLKENIRDVYRTISVSPSGMKLLSTANTLDRPPLVLALTSEMIEEEDQGTPQNKVGDLKSLAAERDGFSEAETKLYQALLDMRMKLAEETGTAPYAICGDQTIKKIAKIRPSTKARLANIDGVNQHFMNTFGDRFLQTVGRLSQGMDLSLDGEAPVHIKKFDINPQRKLTPAKFDAWKLWEEKGKSFQEIANTPGKAPIKEQTVISYILEAAREGCKINWTRLLGEIGLTSEIALQIRSAVTKVGSRDRLKPIKEELPEVVSYDHIKAFLTLDEVGESAEEILGCKPSSSLSPQNNETKSETGSSKWASLSPQNNETKSETGSSKWASFIKGRAASHPSDNISDLCTTPPTLGSPEAPTRTKQPRSDESELEEASAKKLHLTVDQEKTSNDSSGATVDSVMEWVANHDGVSLSDIVNHFKGSKTEFITDLLGNLEGEFSIFKKNGLYRAL